jgi:undecaprenyl-diphosphatase
VLIWIAAVLGIVEGLTEFLPVSSTGHLILVGHALGVEGEASKAFEVVIQSGAMFAVVVHYRALLWTRIVGLARRQPESLKLASALLAAFVPTAIAGILLRKIIKAYLFRPVPVAVALLVGGVAMIAIERALAKNALVEGSEGTKLEDVNVRRGLLVGLSQCLSLWPGTSRAMCTIVGGRLTGLSTRVSAEFSFLLAIPVLGAATALDLAKSGRELVATRQAQLTLIVGFVVSFAVAWGVIALFLRFLRTRGLEPFGWYRIAVGLVVLAAIRWMGLHFGAP